MDFVPAVHPHYFILQKSFWCGVCTPVVGGGGSGEQCSLSGVDRQYTKAYIIYTDNGYIPT